MKHSQELARKETELREKFDLLMAKGNEATEAELKEADALIGEIETMAAKRKEAELEKALREIEKIVSLENPPEVSFGKICKSCSYAELCWS